MKKKVLILCTGNSCRSIIAEALINSQLINIIAYSSGVKPSGKVNLNAKIVHVSFEDPDGKEYKAFERTYNDIQTILLPQVEKELNY